jgi:hypothetical protein
MIQLAIELESHIMLLAKFYKIIEFLIQRHQRLFIFTPLLNNFFNPNDLFFIQFIFHLIYKLIEVERRRSGSIFVSPNQLKGQIYYFRS